MFLKPILYWRQFFGGGIFMHGSHVGREFVRMRRIKKNTHTTAFYNNFIENIFLLN